MTHTSDARFTVRVSTRHHQLTADDMERFSGGLDALIRLTESFPKTDVLIGVSYRARTEDYAVKVTLSIPGTTLIARRHDEVAYTAYEKCVDGLVRALKDHKRRLRHVPEWRQGVDRNSIAPLSIEPDVSRAVADGDYAAFRQATQGYDAKVRADVCRWVEKHPAAREGVGRLFTIADAVEEVFLTAFEGMSGRPREVTFEAWLTNLIAPAVRSLLHDNVSELQAVSLARTLRGVAATREGM